VQLQEQTADFEEAGIGIVAITYDAPELQQVFIDAASITYPLLSDIGAETILTLGILNEQYEPGDLAYGIPHPGVFVVDPEMKIAGKIFVGDYRVRVDGEGTLAFALKVLGKQ
jgi:peroxiredoxin